MTRYQHPTTAEIITLVREEEPGAFRIAMFDGTEDIIDAAELAEYTAIDDAEDEDDPEDDIALFFRYRQARERARVAALRAAR